MALIQKTIFDSRIFLSLTNVFQLIYVQFTQNFIRTSALRLLALRGMRTLCVRRVALQAPGITQSKLFWDFLPLYLYTVNKSKQIIYHIDLKI